MFYTKSIYSIILPSSGLYNSLTSSPIYSCKGAKTSYSFNKLFFLAGAVSKTIITHVSSLQTTQIGEVFHAWVEYGNCVLFITEYNHRNRLRREVAVLHIREVF